MLFKNTWTENSTNVSLKHLLLLEERRISEEARKRILWHVLITQLHCITSFSQVDLPALWRWRLEFTSLFVSYVLLYSTEWITCEWQTRCFQINNSPDNAFLNWKRRVLCWPSLPAFFTWGREQLTRMGGCCRLGWGCRVAPPLLMTLYSYAAGRENNSTLIWKQEIKGSLTSSNWYCWYH